MAAMPCLAAVLVFALYFGWYLKRQLVRSRQEQSFEAEALRSEFELFRAEGVPSPPPNGFNLNRRPDTVRRLRSGQALDSITAATGWSLPEIALLQKVERIAAGRKDHA